METSSKTISSTEEDNAMDVFMDGPFLQWLRGFPESPARLNFEDLTNGVFLHNILQNFDAAFTDSHTMHQNPSSFHDRVTNMEMLVKRLKSYYEDELGQTVVVKLPDALAICHEPPISKSLEEMEKLMLLILGAAVQCSHKEDLIGSIKNLPMQAQLAFVAKIKEVTENPKLIWSSDLSDPLTLEESQRNDLYGLLVSHLKTLVQERDNFSHKLVEITLASPSASHQDTNGITPERNHLALEISEFKAKVRKLNQQLEEKTETLSEYKEEMEKTHAKYAKLRQENLEITQEARAARALRDELDILRERANKVHLLETELQSYKDKMSQMESFKSRLEEVREENKILVETKEMLEDQLESSRKRCAQIMSIENELYKYKAELHNAQLENENDKKRIEELEEENVALQMSSKSSISESQSILAEMESIKSLTTKKVDTNILSEQLGQGMSKIHKLELENRKLRQENEDLRLNKFHEDNNKILALETENKKLSLTIQQLQKVNAKDVETNAGLQKEMRNLETKSHQLEQKIAALKEEDEQYKLEKETMIENLSKQVDSMKKRQVISNNEQMVHLEEENKKMVKQITVLETKMFKLDRENQRLSQKLNDAKEVADKVDDYVSEKEKLQSEIEALRKDNEELVLIKDSHDQMMSNVEQMDNLAKKVAKLEAEKKGLYTENLSLMQDVTKAKKAVEANKVRQEKLQSLEAERDECLETINKLRLKIEALSTTQAKLEELEQENINLKTEAKTLKRSNTTLSRKVDELTAQNSSLESENQKLEKTVENLRNTARSVETLEKEYFSLESSNDKLDRDNKSLIKQVERLKQQMEGREVTLEDLASKVKTIEREKLKLIRDLEQWTGEQSRLDALERENRELSQQRNDERKTTLSLREDLVKERVKCDEISMALEGLHKQLKQLGLNPETLDQDATMLISNERFQNLEGSLNKLLESRQKKIEALEAMLKEIREENCGLRQNIEVQKLKSGSDSSTVMQLKQVVKERDELRAEISRMTVDTKAVTDEKEAYRDKLKKNQETLLNAQIENTTLQSHSASLLSQINHLQASQSALESAKKKLEEAEKTWKSEREDLLRDQVGLQKLHDNLQQDYEMLAREKEAQKEVEKQLRGELKKMKTVSLTLDEDQEKLMRAKEAIDMERESIRSDAKTLANLRSEHARLKDDFRSLFTTNDRVKTEYLNLQADYKGLKANHNQLKLQHTDLKGQLDELKDQFSMLDLEHSKTLNRLDVLATVNQSLESDRKNLMDHVTVLLSQYHELLTQTIDDKEHFHEEEKMLCERVNNLARQKEKLEEKIMDSYKNMSTPNKKKSSLSDQLFGKMKMIKNFKKPQTATSSSIGLMSASSKAMNHNDQDHDSCSSGSSSLGSGSHDMTRSESALELRGSLMRTSGNLPTLSASQMKKSVFRKSMPSHLMEDSEDGNNADDDSVNSFNLANNAPGGSLVNMDEIPTRDFGPERPGQLYNQSLSSHSELGLPNLIQDNRSSARSVSRIYLNGGPSSSTTSDQRSSTPTTTGWKSNNTSPVNGNRNNQRDEKAPPAIPARKVSRPPGMSEPGPPLRPPKPLNGSHRRTSEDTRSSASGGSSPTLGQASVISSSSSIVQHPPDLNSQDSQSQNTAWYEYGCV